MTIDEMIAVLQAYKEGNQIEVRWKSPNNLSWDIISAPGWNFLDHEYRIAPKQTKKIKLDAWIDLAGELRFYKSNTNVIARWTRVPSEDKEITIEE